ncbi:uncharacterized protein GLRG_04326 [Colletotrichum graminicola M1.001]|uniref:Uncharacterized protein n=1 Tax=Colletotrichum graminicola (strain M1.001 / M2 / FGSC 10212) TaxID=645133 RepID=E3QE94_COLGM|nr:uncharacterized protein GLRG_04326 [Colletotrichum graminicola M1.001]EFQ29182.1 hypothetical protein GLRG_04326 [Colletotrichum graminicola M1.001]
MARKPNENRPRKDSGDSGVSGDSGDSGDSGVDVRSSVKAQTLNPMAKEFSFIVPKQDPIKVESPEETSISIPLSMLKKILGSSSPSNIIDAPPQSLDEIIANTIQRFGIPEVRPQYMSLPDPFSTLVMSPTLQPPFVQHTTSPPISPTFGLHNNSMTSPFGMFSQMPGAPLNPSAAGFVPFVPPSKAGIPPRLPPFGSQPNLPASVQPPSRYVPQMKSCYMPAPDYGRQMANGPSMPGSGFIPHLNSCFLPEQPSMPNQGNFLNSNTAPSSVPCIGPRPARKPRVPDAFAQQNYEAYIEWRKANEPGYAHECKDRQSRRAKRLKGADPYP